MGKQYYCAKKKKKEEEPNTIAPEKTKNKVMTLNTLPHQAINLK